MDRLVLCDVSGLLTDLLQKLSGENGQLWKEALREMLRRKVRPMFDIAVDYSRSLSKMIKIGSYDWVNNDITVDHFPIEGSGKQEKNFTLFHFDKTKTSEEVIAEMNKEGFSPAKIEDLLVLGESQPELQKQFPIIALGSVWRGSDGDPLVPCLRWDGIERGLHLSYFAFSWNSRCRFLAVRK